MPDTVFAPYPALMPYKDWFDQRFRRPDGRPFAKKTRERIRKKYGLPVVREGWAQLIHADQAERRLREVFGDAPPTAPRRGRPRTQVS